MPAETATASTEPVDLTDAQSRTSYDSEAELEAARAIAHSEAAASDRRRSIGQGCSHCFRSFAILSQSDSKSHSTDCLRLADLCGPCSREVLQHVIKQGWDHVSPVVVTPPSCY